MNLNSYGANSVMNDIHALQIVAKISHYHTDSFAKHEAFGKAYNTLVALTDEITEQLIGYSGIVPSSLELGTVKAVPTPIELGNEVIKVSKLVIKFAIAKNFENLENLGQELSGLGAQMKFLGRYP